MNPNLSQLKPYPFEKLRKLKSGVNYVGDRTHIALSIGEPKHSPPTAVLNTLKKAVEEVSFYPPTSGSDSLRDAIAGWVSRRFGIEASYVSGATNILPVNGTREALFAIAQTLVDANSSPKVVMPNPFYQIYEGAALLAGAKPVLLPCRPENNFLPELENVDKSIWEQCQLLYLCTPGNPTGVVMSLEYLQKAITLARQYDFVLVSDECYSELYFDNAYPPPGVLQACHTLRPGDFSNCLAFHSLSKRSNLPGLRSGFVAGDDTLISNFLRYRTYHGCAMPGMIQQASITAWGDESHVEENRSLYSTKFDEVIEILKPQITLKKPQAGFY